MTKNDYIEAIIKTVEEYSIYSNQLLELNSEGGVTYGTYLVLGLPYNYAYKWFYGFTGNNKSKLYGNQKKKTKVSEYRIIYNMLLKSLEEIKQELANHQ